VERAKPPSHGRVEFFDSSFGGLALRVTEKGHKSWSLHFRIGGRLRRYTIGSYPAIKPAEARRRAQQALDRVRDGVDPIEEKRANRTAPSTGNFAMLARDYLERKQKNVAPNTYRVTKHTFERDLLPSLGHRAITSITRADVHRVVDAVLARGSRVHANRVLARLRTFLSWTVERGELPVSPAEGIRPPTKERARDRVLTNDEMRWLWSACDAYDSMFAPLVKLLLLTAQRRDEVARLEWSEIDFKSRTWTMPREKTKSDRIHEVPLSDAAIEVLHSIPRVSDRIVFTITGTTPVSGFSQAKRRLDVEMMKVRRRWLGLPESSTAEKTPLSVQIPNWTLHDLRRTSATGMARLNFPPHVVDKVLNHTSGTIRGVAAVYNRFDYLDGRRAALEAWGRYIENLVAPAAVKVMTIHR
jgi:integrase